MSDGQNDRPGPGASAQEIEADIEATREQLADTIDALSDKLDPRAAAVQVKDAAAAQWPSLAVLAVTAVAMVVAWRQLSD